VEHWGNLAQSAAASRIWVAGEVFAVESQNIRPSVAEVPQALYSA
jgi:hypothetical protein